MSAPAKSYDHLLQENQELQARLEEAEELLSAIRTGRIDALMVENPEGAQVYTLQGADQAYRVYVETMNEGAVTLSAAGTILYCNLQFAELVAAPIDQTIGQAFHDFVAGADQDAFAGLMREVNGGNRAEIALEDRAGTLIPVRLSARRMGLGGDEFFCVVVTDLRGQKLQQQLREADRRKDEFLAMLGHELRNPLAIIHNMMEVQRRRDSGDERSADVRDMIDGQVRHMRRLIDDLLDIARITTGKIRLEMARFDLAKVLADSAQAYRENLEANGVTLVLELPGAALFVYGDSTRIAQAIGNLLHNAAKFTDRGGTVTVALSVDVGAKTAFVAVRDTGIGMDNETVKGAFEIFRQADRSLDRSSGGLGLGLALAKALVDMHGGEVTAASAGLGQGSEFVIRLPVEEVAAQVVPEQAAKVAPTRSFRIVVIEDNPIMALSMELLLRQLGHSVEIADNGHDGLTAVARFKPEVVLCDIGLPGLDGYQIARQLRQRDESRKTLLIALSGYGQEEDKRRAMQAGFDIHVVKPLKVEQLESLLANRV